LQVMHGQALLGIYTVQKYCSASETARQVQLGK
jgi:hypothetical protein